MSYKKNPEWSDGPAKKAEEEDEKKPDEEPVKESDAERLLRIEKSNIGSAHDFKLVVSSDGKRGGNPDMISVNDEWNTIVWNGKEMEANIETKESAAMVITRLEVSYDD